jgi:hypothetical protein
MAIVLAQTAGPAWTEIGRWYGTQAGAMRSYLGLSDGATMPVATTADMQAATSDARVVTPVKLTTFANTYEPLFQGRDVESVRWLNAEVLVGRSAANNGGVSFVRRMSLEDLLGGAFRSYAESGEIAVASGGFGTVANDFGSTARLVHGVLRCKTADQGYGAGDEVNVDSVWHAGETRLLTLSAYNGGVTYAFSNNASTPAIVNYATRAHVVITPASWRLVVRAWR